MDAVTAVSGSGPAYFALLAESMIEAGILLGLSREISTDLVVQTMLGTAKLLRDECIPSSCASSSRRPEARRSRRSASSSRPASRRVPECDPGCDDPLARAGGRRRLARSFRRDVCAAAEDERRLDLVLRYTRERAVGEIDLDSATRRDRARRRPRTSRTPVVPRRVRRFASAPAGGQFPPARGAPRAGRSARSSPSRCRCRCRARSGARRARTRRRGSPPSSGRRTPARPHRRAARARRRGVRSMDDRGARAETAGPAEQLDGSDAVLGHTLLDLARLLVGVDVEDEPFTLGKAADLLQPGDRTRADGVGGDSYLGAGRSQAARRHRGRPRRSPGESGRCRRGRRPRESTKATPASVAASAAASASSSPT